MGHICLGAPGPGTGVHSEKQLFLAMTEKGMTSTCPRIMRDFLRRGWAVGLQKGGEQELGDGTLRELVSAECLGLRKWRHPLGAVGSRDAVGFLMGHLHLSRLCWVPCKTWGSPQRQPGLWGSCRSSGRTNHFPLLNTITKPSWRH